jgi:hypothetical protein
MYDDCWLVSYVYVNLFFYLCVYADASTGNVEKKPRKGIFKSTGEKLSEEQQEEELCLLNPMGRSRPVGNPTAGVNNKNNYLTTVGTRGAVEMDSEEDEEIVLVNKCTNSTNSFTPPYWCFVFSDMSLREYVCVTVNIPSGLCRGETGLEGVVDVQLAPCRTKLLVACEWPQSMTDSTCMEQALSVRWKQSRKSRGGNCNQTGTVFNILHAFDLQLHKIRTQNLLGSSSNLGGTATIVLPFQVEHEMVVCETNLDETICSVNVYVVLKKVFKAKDKLVSSRMTVKVSNGMRKSTEGQGSILKKPFFEKVGKVDNGYSSSDNSTCSKERPKKISRK